MASDEGSALTPEIRNNPPSELKTRVASAIVMIALALATAYWGGWPFALFWLAAGVAMMVEWTTMTKVQMPDWTNFVRSPNSPIFGSASQAKQSLGYPIQCIFASGLIVLSLGLMANASWLKVSVVILGCWLFGTIITQGTKGKLWAASGFAYAAVIVLVPPLVRAYPEIGILGLIWMFAVVWATDIAAYFTGRALGGPKLWPAVSPKKTWSGFLGGVCAAVVAGYLVALIGRRLGIDHSFGLASTIALSIVASIASQLGDLGESALKRHCDVKDSSHLIPGHGGVMDRLDGFWAVCLIVGLVLLAGYGAA